MYAKINRCCSVCPFYGGCPHLGGSVKSGSPIVMEMSSKYFSCISDIKQGSPISYIRVAGLPGAL